MIRTITRAALLPAIFWIAGCASQPNPAAEAGFPLEGSAGDLRRLTGRWEGDYRSPSTGRSGTIVFEFKPGDLAYGDVLMMPRAAGAPSSSPAPESANDPTKQMPQVLTIRFAQAAGGAITGDLAPYRDPDCDCEVVTTFTGKLDKDGGTIAGTFTSTQTRSRGRRVSGEWRVSRSARKRETVS
jgi:hypothetical protein